MSIQRTYFCDGPADPGSDEDRCLTNATSPSPPPYLPHGIIEVREVCDRPVEPLHFCSWDCLMKYAANQPIPEIIEGGTLGLGEAER